MERLLKTVQTHSHKTTIITTVSKNIWSVMSATMVQRCGRQDVCDVAARLKREPDDFPLA